MEPTIYRSLQIFIATPGDLNPERNALLEVVTEVNTIKAHHSGFHIDVLGWEQTLPGKGRPQELINREIENCDLFIAALWERWGTPSGKFSSGTEEEFNLAKRLNEEHNRPQIWLFFKTPVSNPHKSISEFKKQHEEQKDFYYHSFNSTNEWKEMLRRFLCKWVDLLEDDTLGVDDCACKADRTQPSDILYRITYQDWIGTSLKVPPIIYFTIEDEASFKSWKLLPHNKKKQYIFDRLSENLGLILGANPYLGQIRYKLSDSQYILLATIVRKYEDSLSESRIFVPNNYAHLCTKSEVEIPFDGYV